MIATADFFVLDYMLLILLGKHIIKIQDGEKLSLWATAVRSSGKRKERTKKIKCARRGARTPDRQIKSLTLYRLSQPGFLSLMTSKEVKSHNMPKKITEKIFLFILLSNHLLIRPFPKIRQFQSAYIVKVTKTLFVCLFEVLCQVI